MREMKDSGVAWIGEIPREWEVSKAKYYVENLDGFRVPIDAASRLPGEYPYWGAGSITDYVNDYLFDETLILLGEDGAPFFDSYRPVAFLINERVWVNNHIHVLRPQNKIDARYMTYYLNIVDYRAYINGSILNKLTQGNFNKIAFILPSIKEQQRIADYLDEKCSKIDEIISKQEQIIEKLKEYKVSVITDAVTKGIKKNAKLKDTGIDWIGQIPNNWECVISRFVIDNIGDINHYMPSSVDKGYPYLMIGDLKEKASDINWDECKHISKADFDELKEKMLSQRGDVIFARYATIGTVCYVDIDDEFLVTYACVTVRPKKSQLDGKYLFYYFKSLAFLEDVKQYINSNTQGNVGIEALYKTKITVPPINEQKEIVDYLDRKNSAINKTILNLENYVSLLTEYKKSLIYEVVTGKKEV